MHPDLSTRRDRGPVLHRNACESASYDSFRDISSALAYLHKRNILLVIKPRLPWALRLSYLLKKITPSRTCQSWDRGGDLAGHQLHAWQTRHEELRQGKQTVSVRCLSSLRQVCLCLLSLSTYCSYSKLVGDYRSLTTRKKEDLSCVVDRMIWGVYVAQYVFFHHIHNTPESAWSYSFDVPSTT